MSRHNGMFVPDPQSMILTYPPMPGFRPRPHTYNSFDVAKILVREGKAKAGKWMETRFFRPDNMRGWTALREALSGPNYTEVETLLSRLGFIWVAGWTGTPKSDVRKAVVDCMRARSFRSKWTWFNHGAIDFVAFKNESDVFLFKMMLEDEQIWEKDLRPQP